MDRVGINWAFDGREWHVWEWADNVLYRTIGSRPGQGVQRREHMQCSYQYAEAISGCQRREAIAIGDGNAAPWERDHEKRLDELIRRCQA